MSSLKSIVTRRSLSFFRQIFTLLLILLVSDCTKLFDDYRDRYVGEWNFEYSWTRQDMGPFGPTGDTTTFAGSINYGPTDKSIIVVFGETSSITKNVEKDGNILNTCEAPQMHGTYTCSGYFEGDTLFHYDTFSRTPPNNIITTITTLTGRKSSNSIHNKPPTISTSTAKGITISGAILCGTVNPNFRSTSVTFEFGPSSTYGNSVSAATQVIDGSGEIPEYAIISGLTPDKDYHFRIKAVNSLGTVSGEDMTFSTPALSEPVIDIDGNSYKTVPIGNQVWMAENLKVIKLNDGSQIPLVTDYKAWEALVNPGYCWLRNDATVAQKQYGALYNWYSVKSNKLCPDGWHVPSRTEWAEVSTYLGGNQLAGGILKETGTTNWLSPNIGANNSSGFSAIPAGQRFSWGSFNDILPGTNASFWTSSTYSAQNENTSYSMLLSNNSTLLTEQSYLSMTYGLSIRCLKGNAPINPDTLPVLSTSNITNIMSNSATGGGKILSTGGTNIISRGVCWSTSSSPTILDKKTLDGSGTGSFTSTITGLSQNTLYYVRAYVTNSAGAYYGNELNFTTLQMALPVLTTIIYPGVSFNSAYSGGNVLSDGGAAITSRGVCWRTTPDPTVDDSKTQIVFGGASFISILSGLSANTIYYIRAYATNNTGTAYGSQYFIQTKKLPEYGLTVKDFDNNEYRTVIIGTQTWMAENLRTTTLNDGTPIPVVSNNNAWYNLKSPGLCWYNENSLDYKNTYGALYNGYAAVSDKLCPTGWHIPTDVEWNSLATYLGGTDIGANKIMEIGPYWTYFNTSADNSSGFSALPAGNRSNDGIYTYIGTYSTWWSSTAFSLPSWYQTWGIYCSSPAISRSQFQVNFGFSVRCLKNN